MTDIKADIPLWKREMMVENAVEALYAVQDYQPTNDARQAYAVGVFDDYVIICVYEGDGDPLHYRADYSVDEDGNVMIADSAEWTQVERQWVEVKMAEKRRDGLAAPGERIMKTYVKDGMGHVEAIGVLFGSPAQRDLEGDYFAPDTDFGPNKGNGVAATLNHRQPLIKSDTTKAQAQKLVEFARRPFKHPVKSAVQDVGILASHVLDLADEYERTVFELAQQGKFRWSSGSAPHMVDRDADGRIKTWHILEWAYTPYAAEPRLPTIAPVKSITQTPLQDDESLEGDQPKSDFENKSTADKPVRPATSRGQKKMDPEQLEQLFNKQLEKTVREIKATVAEETTTAQNERLDAQGEQIKSLSDSINEVLKMIESLPGKEKAGYATDDGGSADPKAKSFGDFLLAVKRNDTKRLATVYKSFQEHKALSEDSGESGGYTVPTEYTPELLQVDAETSPILSRVQRIPVNRPSGEWPALDQYFTPTAGSGQTALAGQVTTDTTAEGGTLTETEPKFKMLEWRLYKTGGYTQASNELIADSPIAIEALLRGLINVAINAKKERDILRGDGVGEALGILNANCAIGITPATDSLFSWADVATMQSRFKMVGGQPPVWAIHPSVWPDILQMEIGTAGANAWVANMQAAQGNRINGYDIVQCEHLPQANNAGNVLLANLFGYVMWEKSDISIAFSEHVGFLTDEGTWRFTARYDGQPWLRAPITLADPQGSYTCSPFVYHND